MGGLRVIFMGTPAFAATALAGLLSSQHPVIAVYSQPPKPAGRGHQLQASATQQLAEHHGIPVYTPKTLRHPDAQAEFAAHAADIVVVAAYGLILPAPILAAPRLGCLNIHASLLPRWRGAAPIQRAIQAGDSVTGVTLMQMDEGLDTGAMWDLLPCPIAANDTASSLHDKLAIIGRDGIIRLLDELASFSQRKPQPQPDNGVTYAHKLDKIDGRFDLSHTAEYLERQWRALTPWPGCFLQLKDEVIKILAVEIVADNTGLPPHAAGTLLSADGVVACGSGALRLLRVQRPSRAPISGAEWCRAVNLQPGDAVA